MRCRDCGYDNKRNTGKCDNCGFALDPQTEPLKEQRAALQKPLVDNKANVIPVELECHKKGKGGFIGLIVFSIGLLGAFLIISNFEQAEYTPEVANIHEIVEVEVPIDSLPILLGAEIVYEFNEEGTSAAPRTNVDLSLIPEGTGVSFLGSNSMSIQPVVNYMIQKMNGNDFRVLVPDSLYAWRDSTKTAFMAVPILPIIEDSTEIQPVELKILFMDEWLRVMIEEYDKDIIEPATSFAFSERVFNRALNQAERTISRRNTEERPVHITLIFPGEATLGEAVEIAESVFVYTDTLGYEGFNFRWVNVTD